jgi:hypothetical protein
MSRIPICDLLYHELRPLTEKERDKAAKLIESLMDMVAECAITFEHYAELHAAKGTAEGQLKAERNRKKANECRSVLSQAHTEVLLDEGK